MNETHLEHPPEVQTAIAELTDAVGELTTEQELRRTALEMALRCFLKPSPEGENTDIIAIATEFYAFLSFSGTDD